MITALKVTMIIYEVILMLIGLGVLIVPDKMPELWRLGRIADYSKSKFFLANAAAIYIAAGVWVVAPGRDPLWHINWVKFTVMKYILTIVVNLYAIAQGYVSFSQVGRGIITDVIFAMTLFAFYPWRAKQGSA